MLKSLRFGQYTIGRGNKIKFIPREITLKKKMARTWIHFYLGPQTSACEQQEVPAEAVECFKRNSDNEEYNHKRSCMHPAP